MRLLKDTEREQLRQLVKACLLEISKLKIEIKKCQKESSKSTDTENIRIKAVKEEFQSHIKKKDDEIAQFNLIIQDKAAEIIELEKIKVYFEAIISRPKKDLTSFQSQIYELLPYDEDTLENLYSQIKSIGFSELTNENFEHALRNLERKGYFKSMDNGETIMWKKLDR
jgi:beta-phosphoglucomutase-like phosphatase (HAD superfamily)